MPFRSTAIPRFQPTPSERGRELLEAAAHKAARELSMVFLCDKSTGSQPASLVDRSHFHSSYTLKSISRKGVSSQPATLLEISPPAQQGKLVLDTWHCGGSCSTDARSQCSNNNNYQSITRKPCKDATRGSWPN